MYSQKGKDNVLICSFIILRSLQDLIDYDGDDLEEIFNLTFEVSAISKVEIILTVVEIFLLKKK